MKQILIKYGLFGAFSGAALFLSGILLGSNLDYGIQELVGYLSILAALSFTYFGIKHYRDRQNQGQLTLWEGLKIGIGITILVALGIAVVDYIYTSVLNPNFAQDYLEASLKKLSEDYSGDELASRSEALRNEVKHYSDSFSLALIMFVTVLIIGSATSLMSALILKSKK